MIILPLARFIQFLAGQLHHGVHTPAPGAGAGGEHGESLLKSSVNSVFSVVINDSCDERFNDLAMSEK
jgi:hypothetical protein